jgi:hypothetical protein
LRLLDRCRIGLSVGSVGSVSLLTPVFINMILVCFNNFKWKKLFMILIYRCQKWKEQVKVSNQWTFWNPILKTDALVNF